MTAKAWLEMHDHWLAWSGAVLGQSEGQALWAQYHRQAGDADEARDHAERALAHATEPRQPLALIAAHRLLGELDTDTGRFDIAQEHLDAIARPRGGVRQRPMSARSPCLPLPISAPPRRHTLTIALSP